MAANILSQVKTIIRRIYSNPPLHGGKIIATIFSDEALKKLWQQEVIAMCDRIAIIRQKLVDAFQIKGINFNFILQQKGMFSYTGLTCEQVNKLQQNYHLYLVGSGRINVAGINEKNLAYIVDSISAVY